MDEGKEEGRKEGGEGGSVLYPVGEMFLHSFKTKQRHVQFKNLRSVSRIILYSCQSIDPKQTTAGRLQTFSPPLLNNLQPPAINKNNEATLCRREEWVSCRGVSEAQQKHAARS